MKIQQLQQKAHSNVHNENRDITHDLASYVLSLIDIDIENYLKRKLWTVTGVFRCNERIKIKHKTLILHDPKRTKYAKWLIE